MRTKYGESFSPTKKKIVLSIGSERTYFFKNPSPTTPAHLLTKNKIITNVRLKFHTVFWCPGGQSWDGDGRIPVT